MKKTILALLILVLALSVTPAICKELHFSWRTYEGTGTSFSLYRDSGSEIIGDNIPKTATTFTYNEVDDKNYHAYYLVAVVKDNNGKVLQESYPSKLIVYAPDSVKINIEGVETLTIEATVNASRTILKSNAKK